MKQCSRYTVMKGKAKRQPAFRILQHVDQFTGSSERWELDASEIIQANGKRAHFPRGDIRAISRKLKQHMSMRLLWTGFCSPSISKHAFRLTLSLHSDQPSNFKQLPWSQYCYYKWLWPFSCCSYFGNVFSYCVSWTCLLCVLKTS